MENATTFFKKAKQTDCFTRWYGSITYTYPHEDNEKKNILNNLSDRLIRFGVAAYVKNVDYVTNDFCVLNFRKSIDSPEKLLQIDHALRLSVKSFRSPITREIETGYSEATLKLLDDVKKQNLEGSIKDLQNGADANAIYDPMSEYPSVLHVAVLFKRADIARELLRYGADPNGGLCIEKPLSVAYDGSNEAKDVIKLLLMYRAEDIPEKRERWLERCGLTFDDIKPRRLIVKENPEPTIKHRRIPVTE